MEGRGGGGFRGSSNKLDSEKLGLLLCSRQFGHHQRAYASEHGRLTT